MSGLPLTFTALAVVLFLFPGIAFLAGLFSSSRVNRDASSLSAPTTLALVLFAATVLNMIGGFAYWAFACRAAESGALCLLPLGGVAGGELALGFVLALTGTSIGLSAVGLFAGAIVVCSIESGRLRTEFLHGWAYDYVRHPGPSTAFIVTSIGHEGQRLGYEGTLHSLRLGSDGRVRTVRLRSVARFRIDGLDPHAPRVRLEEPDDDRWRDTDLLIDGERIENIAIRRLPSLGIFEGDAPSPSDTC